MGTITVGELHQAALPPEARLMAGEAGLQREVSWPASLRTRSPAFQSLKGGEFLLVSTESLRLLDPQLSLARLLQSVSRLDASAVAVVGEVSTEALDLAESLGMPLFALPQGASIPDLEQDIVRSIVEWQADLQRQSQEIYRHFTELAIEGRGLPAIAASLSRTTRRPVAHEDRTFNLSLHGQPLAEKASPEAVAEAFRRGQADLLGWLGNRRVSVSEPPCAEFPLNGLGASRLVAPVVVREGIVGYLSLLGPDGSFREIERLAVVRAAAACAIEVVRENAALDAEDRVGATFLDDLLTGAVVSTDSIRRLATRLGYDLTTPHLVLVCCQHPRPGQPRPRPVAGGLQAAVEQELARQRVRGLCRSWEDRAAVILPSPGPESLRAVVQSLATAVATRLGAPLSVGVGRLSEAPESIPEAYRDAQGALTLGVRLFGPGRVTHYSDLGLYRLLLAFSDAAELSSFYAETLGTLLASDSRGSGELVRTLEAYFASRCSPTEAAERLHVHRNTLLYRLKRIEAITGLDLEDPETRLALNLALHVGQVLGK